MNYNVDKRALYGRWKEPGQVTPFKRLGTFRYDDDPLSRQEMTRATSRFVQDNNTLEFNSFTLAYEFSNKLLAPINLSMLRVQFNMNNIARISSIHQERGLSYPYARTFTFSLNLSF